MKKIVFLLLLTAVTFEDATSAVFSVTYISLNSQLPEQIVKAFDRGKKDLIKALPDEANKTLQIIGYQPLRDLPKGGFSGWYLIVRSLDNPKAVSLDNIDCIGVIVTTDGKILKCAPMANISFCYTITKNILGIVYINSLAAKRHELLGNELDIDIFLTSISYEDSDTLYDSRPDDFSVPPGQPPPMLYTITYFKDFNHSDSTQLFTHEWSFAKAGYPTDTWTFFTYNSNKNQYVETPLSDEIKKQYIAQTVQDPNIMACEQYPSKEAVTFPYKNIVSLNLNDQDVIDQRMSKIH